MEVTPEEVPICSILNFVRNSFTVKSSFPVLQAVDLLAPASIAMFCAVFQHFPLWKVVRLWRFRAVFDSSRLLTSPSLSGVGRTSLRHSDKASYL
jgi:hypothetical protein